PEATLSCNNLKEVSLEIRAVFMDPEKHGMKLFVSREGTIVEHIILTREEPGITLTFTDLDGDMQLRFMSDSVFRPDWYNLPDDRLMSFKLRVVPDSEKLD
ncbi:hypothetical protein K8T06_11020, partial [bacterium]|nr:hypothetical protein [bacterium]